MSLRVIPKDVGIEHNVYNDTPFFWLFLVVCFKMVTTIFACVFVFVCLFSVQPCGFFD